MLKQNMCPLVHKTLCSRNKRSLVIACVTKFMQKKLTEEHFTFASLRHVYSARELTNLPSSPAARTLTKAVFLVPRTSHKQVLASPESKFKLQRSMLFATAHLQREAGLVQRLHSAQNSCNKLCGLKKRSDRSLTDTFPNSSPALAKG